MVDDDKTQLRLVQDGLAREIMEVVFARDARETFEALYRQIPNLIILDLGLPDVDGFEILRSIRVEPRYDAVPVIIFSADHDSESKIKAMDLGAVKYLEKPLHIKEILAHIRAILRFKLKQNKTFEEYKRLSEMTLINPLTGAYNRRALDTFLKSRLSESSRHGIPVSCVIFDIDHFKDANDSHGHHVGDVFLKDISNLLTGLCRQEDALIRYGGEEYLVILFHTPQDSAEIFGERERVCSRTQRSRPSHLFRYLIQRFSFLFPTPLLIPCSLPDHWSLSRRGGEGGLPTPAFAIQSHIPG
jgi:diguanylate cyclase (GGDEF)-like protein